MYTLGLIGYPITHSLSPWIQNSFLKQTKIEGTYELFESSAGKSLASSVSSLRAMDVNGFNVTVPYKEAIIPFLDHMDDQAKEIGAVNTVVCKNDKWVGYNTDGKGYVRSLEVRFPTLFSGEPIHVLLLGAGGAARGIYHALLEENCAQVTIANRTVASAEEIIANHHPGVSSKVCSLEEAATSLSSYDLIIQTSTVGMKPNVDQTIIPLDHVKEGTIVSDIVYQPIETAFLKEAKLHHCQIHYGHTMLLYQAQYAFELWTNTSPQINSMDVDLQHILEGK